MKYLDNVPFSSKAATKAYRDNYDNIFRNGKKKKSKNLKELSRLTQEFGGYDKELAHLSLFEPKIKQKPK